MARATATTTRTSLVEDINRIIVEAEELLKAAGEEGAGDVRALKAKMQQNLDLAKRRLLELEDSLRETTRVATEKTRAAAQATDTYVHDHPWQTIAVVAGLGVTLGLLLNRRH